MELEEILYYIAELEEEDIEAIYWNYGFGIYDEFIEQIKKEHNDK